MSLKWPNDVLADGRKLAGILLESESGDAPAIVVIGMGVNIVSAPHDVPFPAVSLHALGQNVGAEHVFAELSDAWVDFYAVWDNGRGLDAIRAQWLTHAAGLGREIFRDVRAEDAPRVVERMLKAYLAHRASRDEPFFAFTRRHEVEQLESMFAAEAVE